MLAPAEFERLARAAIAVMGGTQHPAQGPLSGAEEHRLREAWGRRPDTAARSGPTAEAWLRNAVAESVGVSPPRGADCSTVNALDLLAVLGMAGDAKRQAGLDPEAPGSPSAAESTAALLASLDDGAEAEEEDGALVASASPRRVLRSARAARDDPWRAAARAAFHGLCAPGPEGEPVVGVGPVRRFAYLVLRRHQVPAGVAEAAAMRITQHFPLHHAAPHHAAEPRTAGPQGGRRRGSMGGSVRRRSAAALGASQGRSVPEADGRLEGRAEGRALLPARGVDIATVGPAVTFDEFCAAVVAPLRHVLDEHLLRAESVEGGGVTTSLAALVQRMQPSLFLKPPPSGTAAAARRLRDIEDTAAKRSTAFDAVWGDPAVFRHRCVLRRTPLPHLRAVSGRLLSRFVARLVQRRAITDGLSRWVDAAVRALSAAIRLLTEHAAVCSHCRELRRCLRPPGWQSSAASLQHCYSGGSDAFGSGSFPSAAFPSAAFPSASSFQGSATPPSGSAASPALSPVAASASGLSLSGGTPRPPPLTARPRAPRPPPAPVQPDTVVRGVFRRTAAAHARPPSPPPLPPPASAWPRARMPRRPRTARRPLPSHGDPPDPADDTVRAIYHRLGVH